MRLFIRPCKVTASKNQHIHDNIGRIIEVTISRGCNYEDVRGMYYSFNGVGLLLDDLPEEKQRQIEQYSEEFLRKRGG